jgi:hypothetical protein
LWLKSSWISHSSSTPKGFTTARMRCSKSHTSGSCSGPHKSQREQQTPVFGSHTHRPTWCVAMLVSQDLAKF